MLIASFGEQRSEERLPSCSTSSPAFSTSDRQLHNTRLVALHPPTIPDKIKCLLYRHGRQVSKVGFTESSEERLKYSRSPRMR